MRRDPSTALKVAIFFVVVPVGVLLGVILVPGEYLMMFLVSVIVLIASFWMMQKAIRVLDFRRMTFAAFWYYAYLAMIWVPGFLIFAGVEIRDYGFLVRIPHLYSFNLALQMTLLTVPLGILLVNGLFRFDSKEIKQYFERPLEGAAPKPAVYIMFFAAALALVALYISDVNTLPVIQLFLDPGDYAYLADLREAAFTDLNSPLIYVFSVLREAIFPFLVAVALGGYLYTRKTVWLLIFCATLIVAVFYASISIARGPVATVFLVAVVFYYLYMAGRFSLRKLALGAPVIVLAFPVLVSMMRHSTAGFLDSLSQIAIRILYAPAYVAYVYFEVVPAEIGFQHGATIGKLAWLMGIDHFNMGLYILLHIYRDSPLSGGAGGAFFADFYANWGLPGVVVSGLLLGGLMQILQIFIMRRKKTIFSLGATAFFFYAFWMTTSRSLPTVLMSTGVVFVLALWLTIEWTDRLAGFLRGHRGLEGKSPHRELAPGPYLPRRVPR